MENLKKCACCLEYKSLEEFYGTRRGRQSKDNYCKECRKASNKKNYQENKDKIILKSTIRQFKNEQEYKQYQKEYRAKRKP